MVSTLVLVVSGLAAGVVAGPAASAQIATDREPARRPMPSPNDSLPVGGAGPRVLSTIALVKGYYPFGVAVAPDGRVYVANSNGGSVSVIDPANGNAVSTILLGSDPTGVAVAPDGRVYVASSGGSVSVIDPANGNAVSTIGVGPHPRGVAVAPDGRVYVSNLSSESVSVIDATSNAVVSTITVGDEPTGVAVANGRVYVANTGTGSVSVIDATSNAVVSTITAPFGPRGIAVANGRVYVANSDGDSVSVIDATSNAVVSTITVGDNPRGVAVAPDGRVYVANFSGGSVSVIDAASNAVVSTIMVGVGPVGVGVAPNGRVYVTNFWGGTVSVIGELSLVASTTSISGAKGKPIAPVTITAVGYSPIGVVPIQGSALPSGLTIAAGSNPGTWVISGTPTAAGDTTTRFVGYDSMTVQKWVEVTFAIEEGAPVTGTCPVTAPTGEGTDADPYQLTSAANLNWIVGHKKSWSKSFKQTDDIDMAGCTWLESIGSSSTPFTGTYAGRGKVISHLTVSAPTLSRTGFIGYANGATIRGVSLRDASISGKTAVGGMVGFAAGSTRVTESSVTGAVNGNSLVGGLVGSLNGTSSISNSFARASVSALGGTLTPTAGGLAGVSTTSTASITNSYSTGAISSSGYTGPIIGYSAGETVNDTFWDSSTSKVKSNGVGLARTTGQMTSQPTFADVGWKITDGWSPAQVWSICPSVNDGYPFHSALYSASPCPNLAASTASVNASTGLRIAPVTFTPSGFPGSTKGSAPTFKVTSGTLPTGLALDAETGVITGTPTVKTPLVTVTVTATQAGVSASASVDVKVAKVLGRTGNCESKTSGSKIVTTCTTPGIQQIDVPTGYTLTALDLRGGDGAPLNGVPGGAGARVQLPGSGVEPVTAASTIVVTVGQGGRPDQLGSRPGGGYTAVQEVGPDGQGGALIAASGGGGGGYTISAQNAAFCGQFADIPFMFGECFMSPGRLAINSAGAEGHVGTPAPGWESQASGGAGTASTSKSQASTAGDAGRSFAPSTGTVTSNTWGGFTDEGVGNSGHVVITFTRASTAVAPSTAAGGACTPTTPKLGDTVLCTQVGLARVTVPDDAEIARLEVVGAGGGFGQTAGGAYLAGGNGAAVSGIADVSATSSIDVVVGAGGKSWFYSPTGAAPFTWYGLGGGWSAVAKTGSLATLLAGGGGGGDGFAADWSPLPVTDRVTGAAFVQGVTAGSTFPVAGSTVWPANPSVVGEGPHGGAQGASWSNGPDLLSSSFDAANGSEGGHGFDPTVTASGYVNGRDGFVMLRFCAKPGAPSVTSVSPGGTSGAATVDVVAAAGADNGCAADKYEFRTSTTGEWVSAPALNFSIVYDLTSGQSVCVQMRSHNEAGWGRASASTCGNARNSAADAAAAGGGGTGGSGVTITLSGAGASPTTVNGAIGSTFTILDAQVTWTSDPYVRADGSGGAITDATSLTLCMNNATSCKVPRGGSQTYRIDAYGTLVTYYGNGTATTITVAPV
jgi:YVTN family beta-propeller protein